MRRPWGHYPQGHEYPDPLRRISASQVFSFNKYRLPTINNQLQANPKVTGGRDETRRRNRKDSKPGKASKNAGRSATGCTPSLRASPTAKRPRAQRVGGCSSRVGLCWAVFRDRNALSSQFYIARESKDDIYKQEEDTNQ
jgi:hypothetical protein